MKLDFGLLFPSGKHFLAAVAIGLILALPATAQARRSEKDAIQSQVTAIAGMLGGSDQQERKIAHRQLLEIGQVAMPCLIQARRTGSDQERIGAVVGLALLPIPELTIAGLVDALGDPNPVVRSIAAHALAKVGSFAATDAARALADTDSRISTGAALALARMHEKAIPALSHVLSAKNDLTKAKAAWLLGRIGPQAQAAIPALIRSLKADDTRVTHVVADPGMLYQALSLLDFKAGGFPLKRIGGEAASTLAILLARPGTPIAQAAMYTLGQIGKDAEPALLEILKTGNASQQTASALLLSEIDPDIVQALPDDLRESLAGAKRHQ